MIETIHHLAALEDWDQRSSETYQPAGLAEEGFIHLCTAEQLPGVVERYYQGRTDLRLLTVDTAAVSAPLVWEDSVGTGEKFPHIYGPLDIAAIVSAEPFDATAPNAADPGSSR